MEKDINNEYSKIVDYLVRNDNYHTLPRFSDEQLNYNEFKDFYLGNVKKSTFLANILPSILFLVISLVSFTLFFLKDTNANLGVMIKNNNLEVPILFFGGLFLFFGIVLVVRRFIFKIRVIKIENGYKRGYNQLSFKKYQKILEIIDETNNKMGINQNNLE